MQKSLVIDIETAPITAYVWGLKDQNIGLNQIKQDWSILAWGAKWLGESKVMYMDVRNNKDLYNDKNILEPLWKLLNDAEVIITQNGQRFDGPRINSRFILHGMNPPSPYKHLDTYKLVKHVAQFTSNKLEYLTDKLCVKYKKTSHAKFAGMRLWSECLNGNKEAWEEMRKYNIQDVLSTEELYNKIKAWAPQSMPKLYNVSQTLPQCRICGVTGKVQKRGFAWKAKKQVQRIQCTACGAWDTL